MLIDNNLIYRLLKVYCSGNVGALSSEKIVI